MWFHLFIVLVFNLVDAKLRNFEIEKLSSIDESVFKKIRKNPALPLMARHAWKLRTPKMLKLMRTRSGDQMAASRSDYIRNNLWEEPTTETSVPLRNMFEISKRDDIGNYIEYLTKMKVFTRNVKQDNAFKAVFNNYSSINTSNVPSTITSSTSHPTVTKHKNFNKNLRPLSSKTTKLHKKKRNRRKSDNVNILDGGADNSINYESDGNENTTVVDDSFLIQGITVKNTMENKLSPISKAVKGSRTILNYWENKLNENRRTLSKRYKIGSKSNKYSTVDTDKSSGNHTKMNTSYHFSVKSNKFAKGDEDKSKYSNLYLRDGYRGNEKYIHHDTKIIYKRPGVNMNVSKDFNIDLKQGQINNTRSNLLMRIFNSETLTQLLKLIPFYDRNVKIAEKISPGINPSSDVTILLEKDKTKDKSPLKFVIPKEDFNNADAILIVFRNLTGLNESRSDIMENGHGEHNSSKTNYTENNNRNEQQNNRTAIGNSTINFTESKYKKPKQIVFNAEKKNKLRKLFPDGDIPKKIGSKIILLNKKLTKLSAKQKRFINNSSKFWREIILNRENYSSNLQISNNTLEVNPAPHGKQSSFIHISPIWKSNNFNKTRSPRSTMFKRRFRSPNKFRIVVKPTKRNNKLGQVSVQIIRDYEPLEDVMGSLKKYFENNPTIVKQRKHLTKVQKVKNKTLDTRRNTTSTKSDLEDNAIERYLNSYLGLESMLLAGRLNNSKIGNQQKTNKSDTQQEYKTDKVNLLSIIKHDNEYKSNFSINHRDKRQSSLSSILQRNVRDVKRVSETRPDRTNPKLYFTKNVFNNLKFYKPNKLLAPHVDQDIYKEYRLAKLLSYLHAINKSVMRRKNVYAAIKNSVIQHNKVSLRSQRTGLKKDFKLNLYKSKPFTVKPKNEFNSLRHIFQKADIQSAEVNNKPPTTELYLITKKMSNESANVIKFTTPSPIGSIYSGPAYNSSKLFSQKSFIRSGEEIRKILAPTELYLTTKNKSNVVSNVHQMKPITPRSKKTHEFRPPSAQITQYSMNAKKNTSQVPKTSVLSKNEFSRTYDITRLTKTADVIKNSKKRELTDSIFFNEHFDFNANEGNHVNHHEDTFNADIGSVGQVGVYEQLELNDHPGVLAANYTTTSNNKKTYKNTHLTYRDLKNTVWVHPEKQTLFSSNVPSRRKYVRNNDKSVETVTIGIENVKTKGYINLSTARKLYSDLDPLKTDDGIPQFEKDHAVKNREISDPYLHPQLDEYNDEFFRDNNVETNRIGVDYVNYNLEDGDDLKEHVQANYDKYSVGYENFAAEQILPRQNVKQAKYILPKVHTWTKIIPDLHSNELSQDELYKYSSTVEKPKRLRPNFDHINLNKEHKDASDDKDNPNPTDVINKYYDRNEKRKIVMRLREKNNTTNNAKKLKKQPSQEKVYINVPTTAEIFAADLFLDNLKVYVHTPAPKTKKNILHNSRQLVGLWSENHMPHVANSIINGVPPLGIWTHNNAYHTVRPTVLDAERIPPEEEFDRRRRRRDITKRRSRLICILVKRPDQQEMVKHVKATWGSRCDVIALITSKNNKKNYLWEFTKAGLGFVYDLNHKDGDWILKADIDSYVVVENLKHMVKDYDPNAPLYFGMLGLSDFSNFVISKGALKVLVTGSKGAQACQVALDDGIGDCLEFLGVKAVDSRDRLGRERFYPISPFSFNPGPGKADQAVTTSWSDYAVAFKNVDYQDMYALDYLIYRIQPYNAPKAILKKIDKFSAARARGNNAINKPHHVKPFLTENHVFPYKYLSKSNNNASKAIELDELKNQVKQLKELSVLKLF